MNKVIQGIEIPTGDTGGIEPVAQSADFKAVAAEEEFMNEFVTIVVPASNNENDSPHVVVNCNGTNQVIIRGAPVRVRRKYVEILARAKELKYRQETRNPAAPDQISMLQTAALSYPFQVIEDQNRKGAAWLLHILNEPVN
jgi:hypothetical protein